MTILEAYNITKSFNTNYFQINYFQTNYEKEKPFLSSEITLIKTIVEKKLKHYYLAPNADDRIISKAISKKKYDSYQIKEEILPQMSKKRIKEEMFFTSVGLISEEDFYLAEDIMENTDFLKRKDLEIDSVYLDIKGREFLYTGDLIMNPKKRREQKYKSQLLSLKNKIFIHLTSVNLLEFSHKYKEDICIRVTDFKSESKRLK